MQAKNKYIKKRENDYLLAHFQVRDLGARAGFHVHTFSGKKRQQKPAAALTEGGNRTGLSWKQVSFLGGLWTYMPSIFGNDIQTGKPGPQKEEPQGSLCLNTHTQKSLSRVRLFATPWIVAHQAPRSMGFSRHEYWSGLPFPSLIWTVRSPEYDLFNLYS